MRGVAEKLPPPRGLYGEFPLGRPLGKPNDPAFQHDVLARAFALLDRPEGPILEDHPEVIESDTQPLACPMPPRYDPNLPEAVDEARGLRHAYDRTLAPVEVRAHLNKLGVIADNSCRRVGDTLVIQAVFFPNHLGWVAIK